MKIILIAGMKQSGSTLTFNLIQQLYKNIGLKVDSCWIHDYYKNDFNHECDILVIKAHEFDNRMITKIHKIILPIRDVRDAAISAFVRFMEKKPLDMNYCIKKMEENINIFNMWTTHLHNNNIQFFEFIYETYKMNPHEYIKSLLNYLEIQIASNLIIQVIEYVDQLHISKDIVIKDDFTYKNLQYKKTLITQNHNTSGGKSKKYESFFNKEQNAMILKNNKIHNFLKIYGYCL